MIEVHLQQVTELLHGELRGDAAVNCHGAVIDTRAIAGGELFFALAGERVDGHDYLEAADSAGASAAIVERFVEGLGLPQIKVSNVRQALGQLAAWWRTQLSGKVLAITGSNGKTTVKEMLAAILSQRGKTVATKGNYNNDLGMPLTLLSVDRDCDYAVLEMGANHFGEIEYMTFIAKPDVAMVNNAGPAHLEGFGDISGVARAKGEIYSGLNENGVAIINADDAKSDTWRSLCADKQVSSFAMDAAADITGVWSAMDQELLISYADQQVAVKLNVLGKHNAMNGLAASASALAAGASLNDVKAGLESVQAVDGRLKLIECQPGLQLIDDSYNANPASLLAGVDVAVNTAVGQAWLALGDLGELGANAEQVHADLGEQLKQRGIARLFTLGTYSAHTAKVFNDGAAAFSECDALVAAVQQSLEQALQNQEPITLLVKGSRSAQMERVVKALQANMEANGS